MNIEVEKLDLNSGLTSNLCELQRLTDTIREREDEMVSAFDRSIEETQNLQHLNDICLLERTIGRKQNQKILVNYTPKYVAHVFSNTSEDPKFFADSISNIIDTSFTANIHQKIINARHRLKLLHINPYKRMSGIFHVNNIQLLTNDLSNRILALYDDHGNINPGINRNTLIGYTAEIEIINNLIKNLDTFINQLK